MNHPPERKAAARQLYVGGAKLADIAARMGIPRSTLHQWREQEGWEQERTESEGYGRDVRAVKRKLLKVLKTGDQKPDPQDVFAWTRMESVYPEHRYNPASDPSAKQRLSLEIIEDLVIHLGEEDPGALKALRPHLRAFLARYRAEDVTDA